MELQLCQHSPLRNRTARLTSCQPRFNTSPSGSALSSPHLLFLLRELRTLLVSKLLTPLTFRGILPPSGLSPLADTGGARVGCSSVFSTGAVATSVLPFSPVTSFPLDWDAPESFAEWALRAADFVLLDDFDLPAEYDGGACEAKWAWGWDVVKCKVDELVELGGSLARRIWRSSSVTHEFHSCHRDEPAGLPTSATHHPPEPSGFRRTHRPDRLHPSDLGPLVPPLSTSRPFLQFGPAA